MAVKTLYLKDAVASGSNFGSLQDGGTAPTAASMVTGWIVAKTANTVPYSRLKYATKQIASTFNATDQLGTAAMPTNTLADAFRSENALTGDFASGSWSFAIKVRATTASAQNGAVVIRVWASTSATGASGNRELTTAIQTGTTAITPSVTTDSSTTVTWSAPSITLNNEYLFVQMEWKVVVASGNNAADWVLRAGSVITTTNFSITQTATSTQSASGSMSVTAGVSKSVTNAADNTFDPTNLPYGILTNGNKTFSANFLCTAKSKTASVSTDIYAEYRLDVSPTPGSAYMFGFTNAGLNPGDALWNQTGAVCVVNGDGRVVVNTITLGYSTYTSFAAGDVIGVYANAARTRFWVSKNGVWEGDPVGGTGGWDTTSQSGVMASLTAAVTTANFGEITCRLNSAEMQYGAGKPVLPKLGWVATGTLTATGNVPVIHQATVGRVALDTINKGSNIDLTNNNLTFESNTNYSLVGRTFSDLGSTGVLRYFEARIDALNGQLTTGIADKNVVQTTGGTTQGAGQIMCLADNGALLDNLGMPPSSTFITSALAVGNIIGYAFNDTKLWIAVNNAWISGDPNTLTGGYAHGCTAPIRAYGSSYTVGSRGTFRFAASDFTYTPPTGALPLPAGLSASGTMTVTGYVPVTHQVTNVAATTFNPVTKSSRAVLSNGNRTLSEPDPYWYGTAMSAGQHVPGAITYYEMALDVWTVSSFTGIALESRVPDDNYLGYDAQSVGLYTTSSVDCYIYKNGSSFQANIGPFATGDTIGVYVTDTRIYFNKNGGAVHSGDPVLGTGGFPHGLTGAILAGSTVNDTVARHTSRFARSEWVYPPAFPVASFGTPGWSASGTMSVSAAVARFIPITNVAGGSLDPATKGTNAVLSNNNLTVKSNLAAYGNARSVLSYTTGTMGYCEVVQDVLNNASGVGFCNASQDMNNFTGASGQGFGYYPQLDVCYSNGTSTPVTSVTHTAGDVIGMYYNGAKSWFFLNGVNVTGGDPALGTGGFTPVFPITPFFAIACPNGTLAQFTFRFDPASWQYTPSLAVTPFFSGGWLATGNMTATARGVRPASATLTASGSLTATVVLSRGVNGTMASVSAMTVAAAVVRGVTSTQSANGSLTATAQVTRGASAALSSSGTMSIDTEVSNSGGYPINATLGAAGNMVVAANVTAAIASTQSAAGNMAVAGGRSQPIASTQSASGSMAVDGLVSKLVSATLSASGSLTATAAVTRGAASTQASVSAMTVAAQKQLNAAAAWAASGTMIAAAGFTQSGASTQSASGSMTVTAAVIRGASATMTSTSVTTVSVSRSLGVAAAWAASGSLTATVGRSRGISAAFSAHGDMVVYGGVPVRASATLSAQATMWAEARVERLFYADTEVIEVPWDYRELTVPAEHVNFTIDVGPSRAMTVAGGKRVDTQNRRNPRR